MSRLFIDTNIVIDLLARREPFYDEAATLFSKGERGDFELFVSALTFANVHYVLLKQLRTNEVRMVLRKLRLLVSVIDLSEKVIDLSLNDDAFHDYEDALQYYSGRENSIDIIITRNLKDFQPSQLPVMTAGQFLAMD